jgi:subtilisin family serine protease
MKKLFILLFLTFNITNIYCQEITFPFLDIKSMGAYDFIKANPDCDGRDVVIFILDNSVDPSVPGLLKTSTGKPKVIDMQDFSNQLVLDLKQAEFEKNAEIEFLNCGGIKLTGHNDLKYSPKDGKFFYGIIDENKNFKNSPVKDINSNGRTDDKFVIIAFKITINESMLQNFKGLIKPKLNSEQWVYFVDEDNDNNIDDEKANFTYKYNLDYFNFYSGDKSKRPMIVLSANLNPDSEKMTINTCDGSHGTHCGGIACGWEIYNSKGNNGVAPGAYIVSLKIGSNLLSGGATTTAAMKKAYEYGIEFLKESGIKYGVYSMSYGIGSETPGRSEIEKFLNAFTLKHPNIVVVTSNGNSGPGINSTGNPAGANNIISAGAMLPVDVLKNLYGSLRNKPWVTHFSSRGGESNKPDVVSPGGASSSVPAFEKGDAFWGTSMACPQVAGAAAILFSSAEHYNFEVNGAMIKKAIKFGAIPLEGYLHTDQGFGLVNIQNSFDYLKILSERKEYQKVAEYNIETNNSFYTDQKGSSAFWKAGGYYPKGNEKQNITVNAIFYDKLQEEVKHNFYRAYTLSSDSPWLKTDKDEIYIRGGNSATFSMIFDSSKINKPGIYSGRISAKPKGELGSNFVDFDVQANIIIPYKFSAENNYTLNLKNERLSIGDVRRIYIETPFGASGAKIKISPIEGKNFGLVTYLFDPEGRNSGFSASTDDNLKNDIIINLNREQMKDGIWELMPASHYQSLYDSYFDVNIQFFVFNSNTNVINKLNHKQGEYPEGKFKLMGHSNSMIYSTISGEISGYEKSNNIYSKGSSIFSHKFKIGDDISKCQFYLEMSDDEYNKSTDIAFNILDENGKSVLSDGLSRKSDVFTFIPKNPGVYTIEVEAGFTDKRFEMENWKFNFKEKYFYKNKFPLKFDSPLQKFIPGNWTDVKFSLNSSIVQSPDGYNTFGEILIKDSNNEGIMFIQAILLDGNQ